MAFKKFMSALIALFVVGCGSDHYMIGYAGETVYVVEEVEGIDPVSTLGRPSIVHLLDYLCLLYGHDIGLGVHLLFNGQLLQFHC